MTVLIFGGTGGIGSALARRLRTDGRQVHLVGRNRASLEALATDLGASFSVADVNDPEAIDAACAAAGETVSGLAYCVGSITIRPLHRRFPPQRAGRRTRRQGRTARPHGGP